MKSIASILMLAAPLTLGAQPAPLPSGPPQGVLLETLTWLEAERVLTDSTVVVIPLGAAAKEHGPHLPLNNDWIMAEYLKDRVLAEADVVVAPTVNYHFYPAFLEYPGSTSLRLPTAQDLIVDVVRTLAGYGPRRFYVLNTGVSTLRPLQGAAAVLARQGIRLGFTDILKVAGPIEQQIAEQEGGTHADELETSMMLYIAPEVVDMAKAVKDYDPRPRFPLTRDPDGPGKYSPSGVFGDATLAQRWKGETLVEATVAGILQDLEALRQALVPAAEDMAPLLDRYVGTYHIAPDTPITISEEAGRLIYRRGERHYVMMPETSYSFYVGEMARLTFLPDEDGSIGGFYMRSQDTDLFARKDR